MVYILEAHPSDVWQVASNIRDNVVLPTPKDFEERSDVAQTCVNKLGIKFPAVVDGEDDATERAYMAWPDRLYLVDRDGRISYKSRPGPYGFQPAELRAALEQLPLD